MLILISCSDDNTKISEPVNHDPVIHSVTASQQNIRNNETTILTCLATDADGDSLYYNWYADYGTFPNGASDSIVTWKPPNEDGTFEIRILVYDGTERTQDKISIVVELVIMGFACPGIPSVIYEGKTYNTVQIGNQCWLKENLDAGSMIAGTTDAADNGTIEKYCYLDRPENCDKYGGLYIWNEAMKYSTTEGTQGICPDGWHIPTKADYDSLIYTVNEDGNSLKELGQGLVGGAGTNTSGFSALLAGFAQSTFTGYDYESLSSQTFFWGSTEEGNFNATSISLHKSYSEIAQWESSPKRWGYSIRCLKD